MINPSLSELLKKVDCRYTLVMETSKRARQLVGGTQKLVNISSDKPVIIALNEIHEDKVTYEPVKSPAD